MTRSTTVTTLGGGVCLIFPRSCLVIPRLEIKKIQFRNGCIAKRKLRFVMASLRTLNKKIYTKMWMYRINIWILFRILPTHPFIVSVSHWARNLHFILRAIVNIALIALVLLAATEQNVSLHKNFSRVLSLLKSITYFVKLNATCCRYAKAHDTML